MLDKRCHWKVRECSEVYLFVKNKKSRIYYCKFPQYKKTVSTGHTDVRYAYAKAYELLAVIKENRQSSLFKVLENKKSQSMLRYVLSFLPKEKVLTSKTIERLQKVLLDTGMSGKSVNNYVYVLRQAYVGDFPFFKPLNHKATYRKCFPIINFYHFYPKTMNDRLLKLAFFAMTTGCRLGEIKSVEAATLNGKSYLKINGTKTKNAVRTIPVLPETLECIPYLSKGFKTQSYHDSVVEAGKVCGFDVDFIKENNIVFHSFRKMYKTLLESCGINSSWIEYYMGHSQTSKVSQLYFIGDSADDSEVYPKVIEALRRFV